MNQPTDAQMAALGLEIFDKSGLDNFKGMDLQNLVTYRNWLMSMARPFAVPGEPQEAEKDAS